MIVKFQKTVSAGIGTPGSVTTSQVLVLNSLQTTTDPSLTVTGSSTQGNAAIGGYASTSIALSTFVKSLLSAFIDQINDSQFGRSEAALELVSEITSIMNAVTTGAN